MIEYHLKWTDRYGIRFENEIIIRRHFLDTCNEWFYLRGGRQESGISSNSIPVMKRNLREYFGAPKGLRFTTVVKE